MGIPSKSNDRQRICFRRSNACRSCSVAMDEIQQPCSNWELDEQDGVLFCTLYVGSDRQSLHASGGRVRPTGLRVPEVRHLVSR